MPVMLYGDIMNYVNDIIDDVSYEASPTQNRGIYNIWVKSTYLAIPLT